MITNNDMGVAKHNWNEWKVVFEPIQEIGLRPATGSQRGNRHGSVLVTLELHALYEMRLPFGPGNREITELRPVGDLIGWRILLRYQIAANRLPRIILRRCRRCSLNGYGA